MAGRNTVKGTFDERVRPDPLAATKPMPADAAGIVSSTARRCAPRAAHRGHNSPMLLYRLQRLDGDYAVPADHLRRAMAVGQRGSGVVATGNRFTPRAHQAPDASYAGQGPPTAAAARGRRRPERGCTLTTMPMSALSFSSTV